MERTRWVLLAYRLPREPSTPRISLWRRLKRMGVIQLGDGLVTLPHNRDTQEALEWAAEEVVDQGGEATVWVADPTSAADRRGLERRFTEAIAEQYRSLTRSARRAASGSMVGRKRTLTTLRRDLADIKSRDHLGASGRTEAEAALNLLARALERTA